jgi:hypothetical protein
MPAKKTIEMPTQPHGYYLHPVDCYHRAVTRANYETYLRFRIHSPYTPGTNEHIYWLTSFDVWFAQYIQFGSAADGRDEDVISFG